MSPTRRQVAAGLLASPALLSARSGHAAGRPVTTPIDGGFEHLPADPLQAAPFEWRLYDIAGAGAELGDTGSGHDLAARTDGSTAGVIASQVLTLAPGSHTVGVDARSDDATAPEGFSWTLTCLGAKTTLPVAAAPTGGARWSAAWVVPAGCPAQWLQLRVRTTASGEGMSARFDNVVVR